METNDEIEKLIRLLISKVIEKWNKKEYFDSLTIVAKADYVGLGYNVDVHMSNLGKNKHKSQRYIVALHEVDNSE